MRSKQTTIPTLRQTQGQARLSVAYRATARNVHASACPEVLSLTNDRKASKFKGISLCIALNSFERKSPPLVIRGYEFTNTLHVGLIASHLTNWPIDLTVCRFFCLCEKLFNKKALIVLFILVLSCLGQFWLVKSITYNSKNTKWREKTQNDVRKHKMTWENTWKILVF